MPLNLNRVVLVTGKGGVGKTSLAAGLSLHASKRKKVFFVEFGDPESGRRMLGQMRAVVHQVIEPDDSIQLAIEDMLRSKILAKLFASNFAVKPMLKAAPVLKELAMLEHVRRLAEEHKEAVLVVDMPATGHVLAWLRLPEQLRRLIRTGPLADIASKVADRLMAKSNTSIVVVTLPEKMVMAETAELCAALEQKVGIRPELIVVNRVPQALHMPTIPPSIEGKEDVIDLLEARREIKEETEAAVKEFGLTNEVVYVPECHEDPTPEWIAEILLKNNVIFVG